MDNQIDNLTVPYFAHEGTTARLERTIKRLIICLVLSIVLMFASNALWLYAWMQYDYVDTNTTTESVNVDGGDSGIANYIGNDGSITNGKD